MKDLSIDQKIELRQTVLPSLFNNGVVLSVEPMNLIEQIFEQVNQGKCEILVLVEQMREVAAVGHAIYESISGSRITNQKNPVILIGANVRVSVKSTSLLEARHFHGVRWGAILDMSHGRHLYKLMSTQMVDRRLYVKDGKITGRNQIEVYLPRNVVFSGNGLQDVKVTESFAYLYID